MEDCSVTALTTEDDEMCIPVTYEYQTVSRSGGRDCRREEVELCDTSFHLKPVPREKRMCISLPSVQCNKPEGREGRSCQQYRAKPKCKKVRCTEPMAVPDKNCRKEHVRVCGDIK